MFVLRNTNHGVNVDGQNRLHPYYLVYVGQDGEVRLHHTEVKPILDLLRSACKGQSEPIRPLYTAFNEETKDGRNMETYSQLLDQGIYSMIDHKEEKDLESLFSSGGTSALLNTISGIDDFELIAFIVIREET